MGGVTITGAKEGFNGLLAVTGYGSRTVRVARVGYGVEIYSEQESNAQSKAFYPGWLQDPDFTLEILHATLAERDGFNQWLSTYMERVTRGSIAQGSMLVYVPTRNFTRRAVPTGTLTLGDSINAQGKAYRTTLTFRGATDPMSAKAASSFRAAKVDPKGSAPFYPAGSQKKGEESLDGTIFDAATDPAVAALLDHYGVTRAPGIPLHGNPGLR